MENTLTTIAEARIFNFRGIQVMLDRDLAELYGVSTKALNQAFKRNKERFPASFAFTLEDGERVSLRSQIVTLENRASIGKGTHSKYEHHAQYYHNLRALGLEYETLDYTRALPFLGMLAGSV